MEHLGDMMGVGAKGQEEPPPRLIQAVQLPRGSGEQNMVPSS